MVRKALTQEEIYDLFQAARGGDSSALARLGEVSSYYGKKANERIKEFREADVSSQALKRAEHFVREEMGREKFSRAKKMDAYDLYKNASEARRFIRAKTGTVARERKRMGKVLEKLSEPTAKRTWSIPEGLQTGEERKQFEKFLGSSAWDEIKNTMGSATMKEVSERIDQGANVDELLDAYQMSLEDENFSFQEYVEGWTYSYDQNQG